MIRFGMANKADLRRRWLGGIALAAAIGMLIAGETVLHGRLNGVNLVIFYMVCFVLTFIAILVAFLDLSVVRRRTRDEQRALFENTLGEIVRQKEAQSAKRGPGASPDSAKPPTS